jgi:asparagine synthase (glutamine-hydrolysing)
MCGIAGIISPEPPGRELLERMGALLVHRGPDDSGVLVRPGVGFVHKRLSILDLEASRQPMSTPDDRYHIVYNGEIYNFREIRERLLAQGHRFSTTGDTEVLLRLYIEDGPDCVRSLQGMFAFAIWDSVERTLFCARDHYGQKPFFYAADGGRFVFGSEIKAVLAGCRNGAGALDLSTLYHYVGLRFCPGDSTLFAGVKKLPPASSLLWRDGRVTVRRYWEISYTDKLRGSEASLAEELHERLRRTIDLHLVSDVRVGTFLSGGVDSSLVTAIASQLVEGTLPTFSIGSEADDFSELPYAREVAAKFHTEQHDEIVSPDVIQLIPDLVWHMEEPGDPHGVGIYTLSAFTHKFVKVVLGGDGGDEMFAGYTRYRGQQMLESYTMLPRWLRWQLVRPMIRLLPESFSYYSLASKARWMNDASFFTGGERYYHSLVFFRFTDPQKQELFTPEAVRRVENRDTAGWVTRFFDAPNAASLLDKIIYTDTMTRMPEHYLLIADRLSMAFGLELRPPLIDYKLAEFAARIPHQMKMTRKRQKHILKLAGEHYLSRAFLDRTKRGFGYPMGRWFRTDLRPFVTNVLEDSELARQGIFRTDYLRALNEEHQAGSVDHNFRLWMLLNLEVWFRMFLRGWSRDQLREWIAEKSERRMERFDPYPDQQRKRG